MTADEWDRMAEHNRTQATRCIGAGLLEDAEWHIHEYKRCTRIASEIRTEQQRHADRPDTGLAATRYLRTMLLLEDIGQVTWNGETWEN